MIIGFSCLFRLDIINCDMYVGMCPICECECVVNMNLQGDSHRKNVTNGNVLNLIMLLINI